MKFIKEKIIGRFYLLWFFLLLIALDEGFRYLYAVPNCFTWKSLTPFTFTALWAALFTGILAIVPGIAKKILCVFIPVLFSIGILAMAILYHIFGSFFSFADMGYAGDGAQAFSWDYIWVRKGLIVLVLLAVICSVILAICIKRKRKYRWYMPVFGSLAVIAAIVGIVFTDLPLRESNEEDVKWSTIYSDSTNQAIYTGFTDNNKCLHMCGTYQYLFRSFVLTYGIEDAIQNESTYKELDAYYASSEKANHEDNDMTGIFEGKNVIMIMMESMDSWLVNEKYMPNLYGVMQQSINFENNYSPMFVTSAGTFGSEFTANTGLILPTNGINSKAYSTYSYPYSMAYLFRNAGYTANSYHCAGGNMYDRGNIHPNLGYESYVNGSMMGMTHLKLDSELIEGYDQMTADAPFFSFVITYSGHGPYTDQNDEISSPHMEQAEAAIDPSDIPSCASEDDIQEYYRCVAQAMETDEYVGDLMDALEADGHINDTVLIFFTDHYCKYLSNTDMVEEIKGTSIHDMVMQTPFFIYSKDVPAQTVTKLTSVMDILPTVANMFNLDTEYQYYIGDDIFGDGGGYVIFRNYAWYDGDIYYSDDYDGEMTDYIKDMNQEVRARVNMAWDTMKCNYFAHLAKENK